MAAEQGQRHDESDPFHLHFDRVLEETRANDIQQKQYKWMTTEIANQHIGHLRISEPGILMGDHAISSVFLSSESDVSLQYVRRRLYDQLPNANSKQCIQLEESDSRMTPFQRSLYSILGNYIDLYYPGTSCGTASTGSREQIQLVYCLHVLNHVLKTRKTVLVNSTKLRSERISGQVSDDLRDQGFCRPKVLMLLPFRQSAANVIDLFASLLSVDRKSISKGSRFENEFCEVEEHPSSGKKPRDFEETFKGNIDDKFRIGISISKKTMQLYTDFVKSDLIVASPAGLREVIESSRKDSSGCDILSSIEVLIIDQADVLFMQNWDNVLYILQNLNSLPKCQEGIDFSRVRLWSLNGWSKLYRQTLVFSEFDLQSLRIIGSRHCMNYSGHVQITMPLSAGSWVQVVVRMPLEFCKFFPERYTDVDDARFQYFTSRLLPVYADPSMAQTLIFVSSSLDFIRVRNHLKRSDVDHVQLSEYDDAKSVQWARGAFVHSRTHFALITERFHFYRRYKQIRGIKHIMFYDLPAHPHFFAEICNWVRDLRRPLAEDSATCRVLICKYDVLKLKAIVGHKQACKLLSDSDTCTLTPPSVELRS